MSRHRSHVVKPLRLSSVVNAIVASALAGVTLGVIKPLGPLFAYMMGM
jgi:hypothetical protein